MRIRDNKAITMIQLVITIIVMIILASVLLIIALRDTGPKTKAIEAKEETIKAQEREFIRLAYQKCQMDEGMHGIMITPARFGTVLQGYDENTSIRTIEKEEIGDTEIVIQQNHATIHVEVTYTQTKHRYIVQMVIDKNLKWYKVTYLANYGTDRNRVVSTQEIVENENVTIPNLKLKRDFYKIGGWSEDQNAIEPTYRTGDQFLAERDMSLYAVWIRDWDEKDAVCKIGDVKYPSIQEAVDACGNNPDAVTIVMIKDATEDTRALFTTYEGQNIILDLNGYTVSSTNPSTPICTNNGTLNIIDSSGKQTGTINSINGTTILNNGSFTLGTLELPVKIDESPTISGKRIGIDNKGTFNFYDGNVQGSTPIKGDITATPPMFTAVEADPGSSTLTKIHLEVLIIYEARLGHVNYQKVQDALSNAIDGKKETVTLLKDVAITSTLEISEEKNIVFDLDGYTLNCTGVNKAINNQGELEIVDNSEKKTGNITLTSSAECYAIYNERKTFTLTSGKINLSSTTSNKAYGIYNKSDSDINIKGGEINLAANSTSTQYNYGIYNVGEGAVNLSGGTIKNPTNSYNYGIYNVSSGAINIEGGKISSTRTSSYSSGFIGIYNSNGEVTMSSGDIDGYYYGIYNVGGKNIINGGTIYPYCYGIYNTTNKVSFEMSGGTIKTNTPSSSCGIYNNNNIVNIQIKGGTISNVRYGISNYSIKCNSTNNLNSSIEISGGTISCQMYGIYNNNSTINLVKISDGVINANYSSRNNVYGIYNSNTSIIKTLEMTGGTLSSTSTYGSSSYKAVGIYTSTKIDNFNIKGGEIKVSGRYYSYGIYNGNADSNLQVTGGIITSTTSYGSTYTSTDWGVCGAYGIFNKVGASTNISNVEITTQSPGNSYGIHKVSNFEMTSGTINANSTYSSDTTDYFCYGIFNDGEETLKISGGKVNAFNKNTNVNTCYGIFSNKGTIVLGNKDVALSQDQTAISGSSCGVYNTNIELYNGSIQGNKAILYGEITKIRENCRLKTEAQKIYLENITDDPIVRIIETGKGYSSLYDAINAIGEDETKTIEVLQNFELGIKTNFNKNMKLDLNGYTITNNSSYIENTANVEIADSSEGKAGKIIVNNKYGIYNKASITISGGTLECTSNYSCYGIYNEEKGTVVVSGGTVIARGQNTNTSYYRYGIYNEKNGSISILSGKVSFEGSSYTSYAIYNQAGNIQMSGGNITNSYSNVRSYSLYNTGKINMNITGGEINASYYAMYNNSIFSENDGIIDNATITGDYGVYNTGNSIYLKISNTTINGGIQNLSSSGILEISTTTVNGSLHNSGSSGTVIIENASNINGSPYGILNENSTTQIVKVIDGTITGGTNGIHNANTFKGTVILGTKGDGTVSQTSPLIKGNSEYGVHNTDGTLYLYDGRLEGNSLALYNKLTNWEEETYLIYENEDRVLYLSEEPPVVVQIEDDESKQYSSIPKAITEIQHMRAEGEVEEDLPVTIKVIKKIVLSEDDNPVEFPEDENIILDLNGFTLTSAIREKTLINKGKLEITDKSENKEGKLSTDSPTTIQNEAGAELVVSGGTIENRGKQVILNKGELTLKGGTIKIYDCSNSGEMYGIHNVEQGIVNIIEEGNINISECNNTVHGIYSESTNENAINITGGSIDITGQKIQNNSIYCYGITNKASGNITITGGIISINGGVYCNYLYGINNLGAGNIDISGENTLINIEDINANSTVIRRYEYIISNIGSGNITVESGTLKAICNNYYYSNVYGIYVPNTSTGNITFEGGTLEVNNKYNYSSSSSYCAYGIYNIGKGNIDSRITITVNSRFYAYGIYNTNTNGTNDDKIDVSGTLNINGNYYSCGIYNSNKKSINVNGTINSGNSSTSSSAYGILNSSSGQVVVNGNINSIASTSSSSYAYGISNSSSGYIELKGNITSLSRYPCFGIQNTSNGKIDIYGNIDATSTYYESYGISNSSGYITIEGNIKSYAKADDCYGISNNSGTIVMKNGSVFCDNTSTSSNYYTRGISNSSGKIIIGEKNTEENTENLEVPTITVTGGYISNTSGIYSNGSACKIYFYDGIISSRNRAIIGNITEIEAQTELDISKDETTKIETLKLKRIDMPVARILDGEDYYSIQGAIEACGDNVEKTIIILRDSNPGATLIVNNKKKITINLNGFSINNYTRMQNSGTLKVENPMTENESKIDSLIDYGIYNTGTLTVGNITINAPTYGLYNSGTATLNNTKITKTTRGIDNQKTLNMTGGSITGATYAIYNGSSNCKNTLNQVSITECEQGIYNSTSSSNKSDITNSTIDTKTYGINGTVNFDITNTIIKSKIGLNITGGTIAIKGETNIEAKDIGLNMTNGTLTIGEKDGNLQATPIIIGENNGVILDKKVNASMYDGQIKGKKDAINGLIAYTETGYEIRTDTNTNNNNGYYVAYPMPEGTADSVAIVDSVNYSDLQTAINSIEVDGEEKTVKLTNGRRLAYTIVIKEGQSVILDMNGKTLESSAKVAIENNGHLTIIDSSGKNEAKISSSTGTAIRNTGVLTIGTNDGQINANLVTIEGAECGVKSEVIKIVETIEKPKDPNDDTNNTTNTSNTTNTVENNTVSNTVDNEVTNETNTTVNNTTNTVSNNTVENEVSNEISNEVKNETSNTVENTTDNTVNNTTNTTENTTNTSNTVNNTTGSTDPDETEKVRYSEGKVYFYDGTVIGVEGAIVMDDEYGGVIPSPIIPRNCEIKTINEDGKIKWYIGSK